MIRKWFYLFSVAILVLVGLASFFTMKRRWLAIFPIAAAIYIGFSRDTYLPFLGPTVLPCSVLEIQTPEHADTEVNVSGLEPGKKVLFWASEPATEGLAKIKDWQRAYLEFANAGVTVVDESGHASFHVRKPQPYTVPYKGRLESHVHWRVCQDGGFMGPVQTTMI